MTEPPTPYRDGKPLTEIIPPDRRRAKMLALVGASMIAGVSLWVLGGYALDALRVESVSPPVPPTQGYAAGRIKTSVLHGPSGDVMMPPPTRSVVHVWLQGCQDCMPAFEAMRTLESEGGLGVTVPIINVAYGEADPTWAARYGVRSGLVFDVGGASVVKPLGIGTFTTLVLDANGVILHRDRPDRPGYRDRVREAVGPENLGAPTRLPDLSDPYPSPSNETFSVGAVERVVAQHRAGVKRTCWDRQGSDRPSSVNVTVSLTVAPNGTVARTSSMGDHPVIAKCIETQTKAWVFPAPLDETTINIPFKFVRE